MAPVGPTGNLRDSITVGAKLKKSQSRSHTKAGAVEVFIGAAVGDRKKGYHAHLVEFGTSKMAAQPFLRPAWDATKDKVLASISDEIWKALAKSAKTLARKAAAGTISKTAARALSK